MSTIAILREEQGFSGSRSDNLASAERSLPKAALPGKF